MTALQDERRLFASAMRIEHFAARRLGESILVGVACRLQKPVRPVISFGFAGALTCGLTIGDIIDATKVVDKNGTVLWEGNPLGVVNAYTGTVVESDHIVNSAHERARLHIQSGADIVDMESGIYARGGLLRGCVRIVSDTPSERLFSLRVVKFGPKALAALHTVSF